MITTPRPPFLGPRPSRTGRWHAARGACIALASAVGASAAVVVWDGGHNARDNWSFHHNWNPNNNGPSNDGTADLVFSGTVRLTPDSGGAWNLNSITFDSSAGAFTLIGGPLTLQGTAVAAAISNDDTDTQTLNHDLVLGASQTWSATAGQLVFNGTVTLDTNTLTLSGAHAASILGAISGTGGLVKTGSGSLTLSGPNTYSGGTTVSGGTLIGNSTSLQGNITNQAALIFNETSAGSYAGVVSGTGALTKIGSGELTLAGSNTFAGATTISAGTLSLGAANALSDSTAVSIASGATLALGATAETVGSIAGAGSINLGSSTLTAGANDTSTAFSGVMSGTGGFTKAGTGTLTLSGANTYSGGTTVSAGTLAGDSTSLQGNIANEAALIFNQSGSGTYAGVVSGSGTLTKSGDGTLILAGANTYSGATTISSGTLGIAASDRLADSTTLMLGTAASFNLDGHSERVGTLAYDTAFIDFGPAGSANHLLFGDGSAASTGTLTINNYSLLDGDEFAFNGTLGAGFLEGVFFYGIGGGTIFSTGDTITGYGTGWTLIRPDQTPFDIWTGQGADNDWGTNTNWADGSSPVSSAGLKIEFDGTDRLTPIMNGSYTLNTLRFAEGAGSFNLSASGSNSATFAGSVASIIQLSANDQTLNLPVTLDTTTVILTTGAGGLTLAGSISGSGGITKVGAGIAVLDGDNSYGGLTTIREGTLVARHANALGAISTGTTVDSGGTLELQGNITIGAEALSLSGTLLSASGTNAYQGAISATGAVSITSGTLTLSGSSTNTFTGATTVSGGQLDLAKTSGATAVSGNLTIGEGSGTDNVRLLGPDQIADTATVTLGSGGTPVFNVNGQTETIGALASANSAASVQLGSGTLTTGAANTDSIFAGVISGSGNLAKTGSGTFTLSGANTYTGTTAIEAGAIVLAASNVFADAGTITIGSGALLDLAGFHESVGSVSGAGTIDFGSGSDLTLLAGTSTLSGSLTGTGQLIVGAGAVLDLSNAFSNSNLDIVLAGGMLRLTSGYTQTFGSLQVIGSSIIDFGEGAAASILHVDDVSVAGGAQLSVQNWIDAVDFFFSQTSTGSQGTEPNTQIVFNGFTGDDTKWQDYTTQITPVPEPSTYGLIFMGSSLGLLRWHRFRRKRA